MTVKYAARRIVLAEFDVLELDLAGQIGNVLRLEQRAGREPGAAAEAAGRLLRHSLKPAPGCIIPDAENCGPRTRRSPARYVCPFTAYEIAILAEAAAGKTFVNSPSLCGIPSPADLPRWPIRLRPGMALADGELAA